MDDFIMFYFYLVLFSFPVSELVWLIQLFFAKLYTIDTDCSITVLEKQKKIKSTLSIDDYKMKQYY